jgi:hypothetical protein
VKNKDKVAAKRWLELNDTLYKTIDQAMEISESSKSAKIHSELLCDSGQALLDSWNAIGREIGVLDEENNIVDKK